MNITLSPELEHIKEIKDFVQNKQNFNTNSRYFRVEDINIYMGDWVRCESGSNDKEDFKQLSISYRIVPKMFNISNHLEEIKHDMQYYNKDIIDIIELIDDFHTVLEVERDKIDFKMDNVELFLQDIHNKQGD